MKLRIVLFGTSAFGLPAFRAIRNTGQYEIVAVVSQPARHVGRKNLLTAGPVLQWATNESLTVLTPTSLKTNEVQTVLRDLKADVFLVASYGLILPLAVLQTPSRGCLNIHASLLPRYRGASPIAAAISHGETETGITYMVMDEGCDTGPMVQQHIVAIDPTDDRPVLEERLSVLAGLTIIPFLQDWMAGSLQAQPQPTTGYTSAPKLTRQQGRADWHSAVQLERHIRAYRPWPGVWTMWQGQEIKLLAARTEIQPPHEEPGTVRQHQGGWAIACADGWLVPTSVQFSGKKPQPASSIPGSYPGFLNAKLG